MSENTTIGTERDTQSELAYALQPWEGDHDGQRVEEILANADVPPVDEIDPDTEEAWDAAVALLKHVDREVQKKTGEATSETPILGRALDSQGDFRGDAGFENYLRYWVAAYRAYWYATGDIHDARDEVLEMLDQGDLQGAEQAAGLSSPSMGPSY